MPKAALVGVFVIAVGSVGCSKIIPKLDEVMADNRKDYAKAQTLPDLEVPPDLSTEAIRDRMAIPEGGEAAHYSTFQERRADRQRATELEKVQTAAIRVLENEHVLAVEGAPVQVWPKLAQFWEGQGYTLELNDVDLGIIETSWIEDKTQLSRDKFKVFAENGEETGTTVLYISHEGQELVPEGEDLVWQRRPRNPEFERATVEALLAEMSGDGGVRTASEDLPEQVQEVSPVTPKSRQTAAVEGNDDAVVGSMPAETGIPRHAELVSVGGGKFYLTVAEEFPSAWKTTGRALEQAGVDVKDSDKGRGVYVVELVGNDGEAEDGSGVWNKLKFWDRGKASEYQVSLTGVGDKTEVVVLDKNGRWETGDQAGTLLNKLHDALNSGRI